MATAAAAVVAKARRDVISHFMERNAVDAGQAVRCLPERRIQRRMLDRLIDRGVIVATGEDTYFLDVPAYDRWRRSTRKRVAATIGGLAVVGSILAALA